MKEQSIFRDFLTSETVGSFDTEAYMSSIELNNNLKFLMAGEDNSKNK